ncbi:MAG TPA: peptidyl-prolyl cis-trans isomerase, partial [Caulobacteraceae bacterium]
MKVLMRFALVSVAVTALAGCKIPFLHNNASPSGQVAATVNGQEITVREVGVELGNFTSPDPKLQKLARTAALENIITRKLVAQAAVAQGLDKTPDYAVLKQRAVDNLLDQLLEKKLAEQVPAPTEEEANAYVAEHPDMFVQRKIYTVDQVRMARPANPDILKPLQPLKTMAEVEAALDQDHLTYAKGVGTIDALTVDPRLQDQISKLPAGEIFIVPSGGQLLINQIRETQTVPFTGPPATQFALNYLKRSRVQDAVQKQLSTLVGKGLAEVR